MVQSLSIAQRYDRLDVCFRMMTEADLPAVLAIEKSAYSFPWSDGIFRDCLNAGYRCRILERNGGIEGYGISSVAAGEAHILNLCIRPASRQAGLGRMLLEYIMDEARCSHADTMFLEVRASNHAALHLYETAGFNEIGQRRNYYPASQGKEDALIMACLLRQADTIRSRC